MDVGAQSKYCICEEDWTGLCKNSRFSRLFFMFFLEKDHIFFRITFLNFDDDLIEFTGVYFLPIHQNQIIRELVESRRIY